MKEQELDMTELLDFEVSDVVEVEPEVEGELVPIENETDLEEDYLKSRETYHNLIKKGTDALDHILEVAKQSDESRAFEVVGQILKATSDVNKELLDMQKTRLEIKDIESKTGPKNVTNNTLFVGSTKDLQQFLKIDKR